MIDEFIHLKSSSLSKMTTVDDSCEWFDFDDDYDKSTERCCHMSGLKFSQGESNQTIKIDEIIWAISSCTRISKYMEKYR